MPTLVLTPLRYGSEGDERAFFEWLRRIPCVDRFEGVGEELLVYVRRRQISRESLRELTAIFSRYDFDTRQLQQFQVGKSPSTGDRRKTGGPRAKA